MFWEPDNIQRQSLKLPYAGWLPHERVSSQACLGLIAGVEDVSGGFSTGLSFYYASFYEMRPVKVYSGLDGTGTLLATDDLNVTGSFCDAVHQFSCFDESGVSFAGTAESVQFSGLADVILVADLTFGAASLPTPSSSTPEPDALLLFGTGMLGILKLARRKNTSSDRKPTREVT